MMLSASLRYVAAEAGEISFCLLNLPDQIPFIGFAGFEMVLLCDFFDFVDGHLRGSFSGSRWRYQRLLFELLLIADFYQ